MHGAKTVFEFLSRQKNDSEMKRYLEHTYEIKFYYHICNTASEMFDLVKEGYKDNALSNARVFRWFSEFKNGQETVQNIERFGYKSTSGRECGQSMF